MDKYTDLGLSGLINMGNTCYLNAATQCLSNSLELTNYIISGQSKEDVNKSNKEVKMYKEYKRLLNGIWEDNCIIKPISFKTVLGEFDEKFDNNEQHDSQEVLSKLIDLLHISLSYEVKMTYRGTIKNELDKMEVKSLKTWSNHFKKQYSKILEIFYGQYHSKIICLKCKKYSNNFDPFCLISLPITSKCYSIYDCLNEFSKSEVLDSDNQWKCEKCEQLSNAQKIITFWKLPKIMIIVLKRFNYGLSLSKINRKIEFPLDNLDLRNYVDGYHKYESNYEAFGIINHIGNLHFGHYYAYCKNTNGNWYNYDDEDVKLLSNIDMDNAYVIFYRKKE